MPDLLHRLAARLAAWDAEAADAHQAVTFCRSMGQPDRAKRAADRLRQVEAHAALDRAVMAELRAVWPELPGVGQPDAD